MRQLIEDAKYLKYTIFHPFDAFYEIKWRGKGSLLLATLMYVAYSIMQVLSIQYTGFVIGGAPMFLINSISIIVMALAPMLIFIISNWSVATLYNGKGKVKDLYILVGYALLPMIATQAITIIVSNMIIMEEASLLLTFNSMGSLWFCFLIFTGLLTIHEFNGKENMMTLLATLVAAIVIVFLCVLYFTLMEQMITFVTTISQEFLRRW